MTIVNIVNPFWHRCKNTAKVGKGCDIFDDDISTGLV